MTTSQNAINANKQWVKPALVIIGRGKPEESVLAGCKCHAHPTGTLATATNSNCNQVDSKCGACHSNGNSVS